MTLTVIGQKYHGTSWGKVARYIVNYLKMFGVDAIYHDFNYPSPNITDDVLLVPVEWTVGQDPLLLRYIAARAKSIAGFVSTDSTEPGFTAIYLANMLDVVLLTGNFAIDLWKSAIPNKYYSVVHLGIDDELLSKPYNPNPLDPIKQIREYPGIKILLIWHHDTFRKNMDIACQALEELMREKKYDILPIVKVSPFTKFYAPLYLQQNGIVLKATLSESDMVDLYDSVDIVLVPSGAGSAELVAIEAMARGKPVITTTWYSFIEYVPESIQVPCAKWEKPPHDPIADAFSKGDVCRVDKDTLKDVIISVIENLDEWKKLFDIYKHNVLHLWSWRRIVKEELIPALESRNMI